MWEEINSQCSDVPNGISFSIRNAVEMEWLQPKTHQAMCVWIVQRSVLTFWKALTLQQSHHWAERTELFDHANPNVPIATSLVRWGSMSPWRRTRHRSSCSETLRYSLCSIKKENTMVSQKQRTVECIYSWEFLLCQEWWPFRMDLLDRFRYVSNCGVCFRKSILQEPSTKL